MYRPLLAAALALVAAPALAQSSLGMTGVDLRFGLSDTSGTPAFAELRTDVAITAYHGFQADLALSDTASGTVGTLAAHLYMTPRASQKYGLFAFAGDVDGRSATYGGGGAEGRFALTERATLELRGGLGLTHRSGFDFVFAEAGLDHRIGPQLSISATALIAEFDEAAFSAVAHDVRLGLRYSPTGRPWGFFAEVGRDGFSGRDAVSGQTTFRAGLTLTLGNPGRDGSVARSFSTPDPLAPLLRRGLF